MEIENPANSTIRSDLVFPAASWNPRPVLIAGAGSGATHVCLQLRKLGVKNIHVCDFDVVNVENTGPSLYGPRHVGKKKAHMLSEVMEYLTGEPVRAYDCRIEDLGALKEVADTVFLCVDNMDVRRSVIEGQCTVNSDELARNPHVKRVRRIFEGRMSAHFVMAHSLDPGNTEHVTEWLKYWFPQSEALPALLGCGARPVSVGPTASTVANLMVEQFIQWYAFERGEQQSLITQVRYDLSTFEGEAHVW